ncbi:hypothetical protein [Megamonas funiformis]|uniref:hypothetical protein n=1 Tax=Megamonas funiformis TaxID=437897 RepID=UPI0022E95A30|nr:hypothetical protein [Megamonas funiformis]
MNNLLILYLLNEYIKIINIPNRGLINLDLNVEILFKEKEETSLNTMDKKVHKINSKIR